MRSSAQVEQVVRDLPGPSAPVMIYDDYKEDATPPCYLEPLSKLLWITHVYALYHMAWPHPKRQRQPKNKAKNSKVSIN
ncbi:hypothetical protein PR003_g16503 [Phytophthora rubi]|nr:hypothetical protein PR002_g7352 [Phytophthora rubi]KAE9035849.1 hypothetical protein PR002_g7351 [Phytophthora rubi]KAE9040581.1 hypothetical protein PR001_g6995 [Phytophthora rubi]KAE9325350.1 hypothetical protein PR003_g16505 [Phytophthora rubi]KAE9325355.1 hypothetical protein PR003_g16503 [Phytophthora rubi]